MHLVNQERSGTCSGTEMDPARKDRSPAAWILFDGLLQQPVRLRMLSWRVLLEPVHHHELKRGPGYRLHELFRSVIEHAVAGTHPIAVLQKLTAANDGMARTRFVHRHLCDECAFSYCIGNDQYRGIPPIRPAPQHRYQFPISQMRLGRRVSSRPDFG